MLASIYSSSRGFLIGLARVPRDCSRTDRLCLGAPVSAEMTEKSFNLVRDSEKHRTVRAWLMTHVTRQVDRGFCGNGSSPHVDRRVLQHWSKVSHMVRCLTASH